MEPFDRSAPVYTIGVVEELTGLTARQIRYYERQKLISPSRSTGNRRLYSPDDVDRLLLVKELFSRGMTSEGIRRLLDAEEGIRMRDQTAEVSEALRGTESAGHPDHDERPDDTKASRGHKISLSFDDVIIPDIDHAQLVDQLRRGRKLSSVYPVDNQAELVRILQSAPEAGHPDK